MIRLETGQFVSLKEVVDFLQKANLLTALDPFIESHGLFGSFFYNKYFGEDPTALFANPPYIIELPEISMVNGIREYEIIDNQLFIFRRNYFMKSDKMIIDLRSPEYTNPFYAPSMIMGFLAFYPCEVRIGDEYEIGFGKEDLKVLCNGRGKGHTFDVNLFEISSIRDIEKIDEKTLPSLGVRTHDYLRIDNNYYEILCYWQNWLFLKEPITITTLTDFQIIRKIERKIRYIAIPKFKFIAPYPYAPQTSILPFPYNNFPEFVTVIAKITLIPPPAKLVPYVPYFFKLKAPTIDIDTIVKIILDIVWPNPDVEPIEPKIPAIKTVIKQKEFYDIQLAGRQEV